MSATWTLQRSGDGANKTLAEWGVTSAVRTRVNQGVGTLDLVFGGRDFDAANVFPYGAQVVLRRDGVVWFAGRAITPARAAKGGLENQRVRIADAWHDLSRLVFSQPWVTEGGSVNYGVTIHGGTSPVSVDAEINAVLDFAIGHARPLTNAGGVILNTKCPPEVIRDATCADVIRRMLRWCPDAVTWLDYSNYGVTHTGYGDFPRYPVFYAQSSGYRFPVSVNITGGRVADFEVVERTDLSVPAVVFLSRVAQPGISSGSDFDRALSRFARDAYPSGATGTEDGALVMSFDDTGSGAGEGAAQAMWQACQSRAWQGRLVLQDVDCAEDVQIYNRLDLTGGRPEWAVMQANIQQTSDDILHGRTTITFGPPEHLGPQDLVTLLRLNQSRGIVTKNLKKARDTGESGWSASSDAGNGAGLENFTSKQITVCDGGSTKTLIFAVKEAG